MLEGRSLGLGLGALSWAIGKILNFSVPQFPVLSVGANSYVCTTIGSSVRMTRNAV